MLVNQELTPALDCFTGVMLVCSHFAHFGELWWEIWLLKVGKVGISGHGISGGLRHCVQVIAP